MDFDIVLSFFDRSAEHAINGAAASGHCNPIAFRRRATLPSQFGQIIYKCKFIYLFLFHCPHDFISIITWFFFSFPLILGPGPYRTSKCPVRLHQGQLLWLGTLCCYRSRSRQHKSGNFHHHIPLSLPIQWLFHCNLASSTCSFTNGLQILKPLWSRRLVLNFCTSTAPYDLSKCAYALIAHLFLFILFWVFQLLRQRRSIATI